MKVSIIIPTYNDCKYIKEALDSIKNQTFQDLEVVIVDDGSTDDTKEIVSNYIEENNLQSKFKYLYQENQDQLNAIINGLKYITGEYIFILHSDDLIYDESSLEKCVKYMDIHKEVDSIISDLSIIDKDGNVIGIQHVKKYEKKDYIIPLQLLWLGRNLYVDVGFHRKDSYLKVNGENYLKWNTPFWIDFYDNAKMLNVENVDFCFYKYRVFEENYVNSELGLLNVINGELRTATQIMKIFNIPSYKIQYFLYRINNKIGKVYVPKYTNEPQKDRGEIVEFIIKKRFKEKYKNNKFLSSLVSFYYSNSDRKVTLKNDIENVYMGKDVRTFNKKLLDDTLEEGYYEIFEEMKSGFGTVFVQSEEQKEKMENILKFLCIDAKVEIK